MIKQGFNIGNRDWYIMVYYNVHTDKELIEVADILRSVYCKADIISRAIEVLSEPNTGLTFTNFDEHLTLIFIGRATSAEQMYDTIQHELKHAVEHISSYFDVDPQSEKSAYLQGEIARNMFGAAAMAVCPKCNCEV